MADLTDATFVLSVADRQTDMFLLADSRVRVGQSAAHGNWLKDENQDIVICYDTRGVDASVRRNCFRKMPQVNAWVLYSIDNYKMSTGPITLLLPKVGTCEMPAPGMSRCFIHADLKQDQHIELMANAQVCFNNQPEHGSWSVSGKIS